MTPDTALTGGFSDTARDAAFAFRTTLNVLAHPGRIERIAGATPPPPCSVAAGTLLLTLCDKDTPVYLAGAHDTADMRNWLAFHASVPIVGAQDASFAIGTWQALHPLEAYLFGTPEYPDRSATLIVDDATLRADGATLSGPGIRETARLSLPDSPFYAMNRARYPLGIDLFFTDGDRIAGLPRTTRVAG